MLADSPVVGLVKYDLQAQRLTTYPLPARGSGVIAFTKTGGSANSKLFADGQIAAIAKVHGFAVATRDVEPFVAAGVPVVNPWEA